MKILTWSIWNYYFFLASTVFASHDYPFYLNISLKICITWQDFDRGQGHCKAGLWKRSSEPATCYIRASSSWLQKQPVTGQSWTNEQHCLDLCEYIFRILKQKQQQQQKLSHSSREIGVGKCEKNNSLDTKVSAEGEQEVLQVPELKFLCGLRRGSQWSRLSPCNLWCTALEQISMLPPVEKLPVGQVDVSWRGLQPMENPCKSRVWTRTTAHGEEPTVEEEVWWELPLMEDPCWSSLFLKDGPCGVDPYWSSSYRAVVCGKPMKGQFGMDCIP